MKRKIFVFGLLFLGFQSNSQELDVQYAETIKARNIEKNLVFLASDAMKGRNTGSPEQRVAANYIADYFQSAGLAPVNGSYFQKVDLINRSWENVKLISKEKEYQYLNDFYAYSLVPMSAQNRYSAEFIGFAMKEGEWDDYQKVNLKGKLAIAFNGEPKDANGNFVFSGNSDPSEYANDWKRKKEEAQAAGARGLILIYTGKAENFERYLRALQTRVQRFGNKRMVFGEDALTDDFPVLLVSQEMASEIMGVSVEELVDFVERSGSEKKSIQKKWKSSNIAISSNKTDEPVDTYNVVGYLEGTDKKEEVIIMTAHYDHIGVSADGQINNGANDDGSGTVTVMELAKTFGQAAKDGNRLRRSILFMTVTGEEKGLLGSEYYSRHPLFPLENTVCDLNIDMVGRDDYDHVGKPDYIYEIGSDKLSSELRASLVEQNQKHIGLDLDFKYNDPNDPNRFYYRSDHYNFAKHGIPVAFFFNGVHDDYHQPSDTVDKIEFDKIQRVAKLVFYMGWDIANRDKRLVVDSNKP